MAEVVATMENCGLCSTYLIFLLEAVCMTRAQKSLMCQIFAVLQNAQGLMFHSPNGQMGRIPVMGQVYLHLINNTVIFCRTMQ